MANDAPNPPDYTEIAQNMLQMWQEGWKNFATAMTQPTPQGAASPANETKPEAAPEPARAAPQQPAYTPPPQENPQVTNWMEGWEAFMASWAETRPTDTPGDNRPRFGTQPSAPPMAKAAGAASGARDVLFAELARRVEFLHERLVKMESELERLKRRV